MKYVAFASAGGPEALHVAEMPTPQPSADDVLIEVEASGVSRADVLQRRGLYPPPPGASPMLGLEVSGTVVALGDEVRGFTLGDRVCALCNGGGYAQYVAVPAGQVLPMPQEWSFIEAATLPENAFTVFDNVFTRARLRTGELLLVHGGTSGIGTTAIMFARALGARVIATAGSKRKTDACLSLGAELAIDYHTEDVVEVVRGHTGGYGVDVVLDIVGGSSIERDLRMLAVEGRVACIATAEAPTASLDLRLLMQRRGTLFGSSLRPRTHAEKAAIAEGLRERIWPLLGARDTIVPIVDSLYTFSEAASAHRRLESSEHIGKVVLVPDA